MASAPPWVDSLLAFGYASSLIYVLVVIFGLAIGGGDRRGALKDVAIVAVGSMILVVLLSFLTHGSWPYVLPEINLKNPVPQFPVARVGMVTAVLMVAGPHLTRPLRRLGFLAILITAFASIGLSYGTPIHTMGSIGVGLFTAGLFLVIAGTPTGYPDPRWVAEGLRVLGTETTGIRLSDSQSWGVVRFQATDSVGRPVDINVYGRDAFDSQLFSKIWRTMWYREMSPTIMYSRLQAVQHQALVSLMAARGGVSTPDLIAVGNASDDIALVAFYADGPTLDQIDSDLITDELLQAIWGQVKQLHDSSMSHGSLRSTAIQVGDAGPAITNFSLGSLAPDESDRTGDIVELLFSMSILAGPKRAVDAAIEVLGRDRLASALPYLQLPGVSTVSRRQSDDPKGLISELNDLVVAATGAEPIEKVHLRRVSGKGLAVTALLLLMVWALIPALTSVDYSEIWGVLQNSNWTLMVVALVVGQLQFFPQATATMFAVATKLPFWPLLTLQTASQFISLAIPSSAGRVAMNAAFLHKFGVSVTTAIAQGAIDGISGFLVQAAILLVVILTGEVDLNLNIDMADVPWLMILGILVLVVVVVVVAVLKIGRLRERVVPVISQAWGALMVVLRRPSRAFGLLASNFVYWNILGLTLWILLEAVGSGISYGSALFAAAGTSLLAGFMPIPGGVGVAEATMTAILVAFGVDQSTAFAVTVAYRVITFYLPALEGLFGSRWLERNDYI